jgi:hypothetical protein
MLSRDSKAIESKLYIKDDKVYTKEKTIIEFPKWYEDKEFLDIQNVSFLYGIFAILIGDKYSVSLIPTLISTTPLMTKEVERDEEVYIQYIYGKDTPIINNTEVVKRELLSAILFDNFFIKGKVPWFIEYEDLIKIMDNLVYYAKSNLGNYNIANELVISFIARNKNNKNLFYRQKLEGDPEYINMISPFFSTRSTVAKLSSNYFRDSIVSALVQKEEEPTRLENIVRR